MRSTLASAYHIELRHLVEQVALAKRVVLEHLVSPKATSHSFSISTLAEKSRSQADEISLLNAELYAGKGNTVMTRDEVQKHWQDAQLERTRSHIS